MSATEMEQFLSEYEKIMHPTPEDRARLHQVIIDLSMKSKEEQKKWEALPEQQAAKQRKDELLAKQQQEWRDQVKEMMKEFPILDIITTLQESKDIPKQQQQENHNEEHLFTDQQLQNESPTRIKINPIYRDNHNLFLQHYFGSTLALGLNSNNPNKIDLLRGVPPRPSGHPNDNLEFVMTSLVEQGFDEFYIVRPGIKNHSNLGISNFI